MSVSVLEPNIGDFGFIETLETSPPRSPVESFTNSLEMADQDQLDEIIKRQSVLCDDEEKKYQEDKGYQDLLNKKSDSERKHF